MMPTKKATVLGVSIWVMSLANCLEPIAAHAAEPTQVVKITASRYHFTPDRIVLKKGQNVTLELTSSDRTHGFLLRPLGIDTDIPPGKMTDITIRPERAGTYTTICDHYCGLGHNGMKMTIVVEEESATASSAAMMAASDRRAK